MQGLRSTQKKVVISLLLVMLLCLPVIGWSAQSLSSNAADDSAEMIVAMDYEEEEEVEPYEEEVEPDEEEVEPDEEEVEPDEEEVEPDSDDADDAELEDVE